VCEVTATKTQKRKKNPRAPRIRVPNNERALFTLDGTHFVGVLQRLSLSGGSALLSKGPIAHGTTADIDLKTVFGRVHAEIQFLQTGADGIPLAQAFRFVSMGATSSKRLALAAKELEKAGYSDVEQTAVDALTISASAAVGQLLTSIRRLAATVVTSRA
jgi:hypothetical protein